MLLSVTTIAGKHNEQLPQVSNRIFENNTFVSLLLFNVNMARALKIFKKHSAVGVATGRKDPAFRLVSPIFICVVLLNILCEKNLF